MGFFKYSGERISISDKALCILVLFTFRFFFFCTANRSSEAPPPRTVYYSLCLKSDDSNPITPKDIDSWKTLLKVPNIRNYKPVFEATSFPGSLFSALFVVDKGGKD